MRRMVDVTSCGLVGQELRSKKEGSRNMTFEQVCRFHTTICAKQKRNAGLCKLGERCPFSHCLSWRRRNPMHLAYRPNLCPSVLFWMENGKTRVKSYCNRGRGCMYAHTKEEQMYHPLVYKTQICRHWPSCTKYLCPFAHGLEELRNPEDIEFHPIQGPETIEIPNSEFSEHAVHSSSESCHTASSTRNSIVVDTFSEEQKRLKSKASDLQLDFLFLVDEARSCELPDVRALGLSTPKLDARCIDRQCGKRESMYVSSSKREDCDSVSTEASHIGIDSVRGPPSPETCSVSSDRLFLDNFGCSNGKASFESTIPTQLLNRTPAADSKDQHGNISSAKNTTTTNMVPVQSNTSAYPTCPMTEQNVKSFFSFVDDIYFGVRDGNCYIKLNDVGSCSSSDLQRPSPVETTPQRVFTPSCSSSPPTDTYSNPDYPQSFNQESVSHPAFASAVHTLISAYPSFPNFLGQWEQTPDEGSSSCSEPLAHDLHPHPFSDPSLLQLVLQANNKELLNQHFPDASRIWTTALPTPSAAKHPLIDTHGNEKYPHMAIDNNLKDAGSYRTQPDGCFKGDPLLFLNSIPKFLSTIFDEEVNYAM